MDSNTITIPAYEYRALLKKEFELKALTNALFNTEELNYSNTELEFDSSELNAVLRVLWPSAVESRISKILKKMEEA